MTHRPKLRQLHYLCALAQSQHFGKAAKSCHISQSTLSAGIQELEEILGVILVERNNKRVLFTALGEEIVAQSRNILTEVDDLTALCDMSKGVFASKIRIGIIPTIAPFLLPKLLNKLRQVHPILQLFIREDLSGLLVENLRNGDLDLLLLALPYPAKKCTTMHLFYDDFLLAFPPRHAMEKLQKLCTQDLKKQDLLLLEDGHCLRDHALEACKLAQSDITIPYQATSLNTIVQMVANNIGITLLPQMAVDAKILQGTKVKTRAFSEQTVRRSIGLAWRQKTPRQQEFKLLGEFIMEMMNNRS